MQNLVIAISGSKPTYFSMKLMWDPHTARPFTQFMLAGVLDNELAHNLWRALSSDATTAAELGTRTGFVHQLNEEYLRIGQVPPVEFQTLLSTRIIVEVRPGTTGMMAGATVMLTHARDDETIFVGEILRVTNLVYTPR